MVTLAILQRMRWYTVLFILTILAISPIVHAQDSDVLRLDIGTVTNGRIDNDRPRIVYAIDGTRGAVISFDLRITTGNLDAVLTLFRSDGREVLRRDDSQDGQNISLTHTFDADDLYYLVVGRFGYVVGSSSGDFELTVERVGVLSLPGTTLQYGIPISNTITNAQPIIFYTFQGRKGDILNFEMVRSSGNLDPYLQIVNSDRFLIAENDDADTTTRDARIDNVLIEEDGTYIVVATRWSQASGESVGGFVLLISESGNSGLGNSRRAPATMAFGSIREGEITDRQYEQFYNFQAQEDQIITVVMERASQAGLLDSYLIITDANSRRLVEDDDSGSGNNARIANFRVPADGSYTIIATRFDREAGTSTGEYRLTVDSPGFAFDSVSTNIPRLRYGAQVPSIIDNDTPEEFYVFWGVADEIVNITMVRNQGDLDPVVELLDTERVRILRDDDGGNNQNARISAYTLPYTGVYYIRATRYEGSGKLNNTEGSYTLVLSRDAG